MGRPLKIKQSTTVDIGFNSFSTLTAPVIPTGMLSSEYLGVVGGGIGAGQGIATATYPVVKVSAYINGGLQNNCTIITQKGSTKYLVSGSDTVAPSAITPGFSYIIKSLGTTTNWTAIGAGVNPTVGKVFTATAAGSGNGSTSDCGQAVLTPVAAGALTSGQMSISITTGGSTTYAKRLTNKFVWDSSNTRFASNFFVAGGAGSILLGNVVVTGTGGQFAADSTTLTIGQAILTTGTLTGNATITGYSNPSTYYVITTNGTTTFTLSATPAGANIATAAGNTRGLTFTVDASQTFKSGADPVTWTNGTGYLDLADVSQLNT